MIKYVIGLSLLLVSGCDWYHKNKCEWYLVPEPDDIDKVEPGWVSLCARNYEINRQRCLLKAKLNFAKQVHGKPFRYNSMEVKQGPYPKEVTSITVCKPD
ncbi:MAG: hypothetical protein HRU19_04095 [Pseudobacteriovorax sp.]|nr:hypothetical protein [Pseudobacteriovorax sp.]